MSVIMKYLSGFLSFVVLMLFYALLYAEERSVVYTPDELVTRALSQYKLLTAQKLRIDEFRYGKKGAVMWQNPRFDITMGRKSVKERSGYHFGFGVEQGIHYPGKRQLREEIVRFEENRARLSYEEMRSYVRHMVTLHTYKYAAQLQKAIHASGRLKRLRLIGAYMRGRRVVSPQRIIERRIINTRILMLEQDLSRVRADTKVAFLKLNVYTGLPVDALPDVRVTWYTEAPVLDFSGIMKRAKEESYAVRKQDEVVKKSGKEHELAKRERYPDFGFSLFYNEEDAGEKERIVGGGISIPLPLLNRNQYAIDRSRVQMERNRAILLNTRRKLVAELASLFEEYRLYSSLIRKFSINDVKSIEASMRYADREFRKGRVVLQTYLEMDAQSHELLEAVLNAQIRLVEVHSAILYLANVKGGVPSDD